MSDDETNNKICMIDDILNLHSLTNDENHHDQHHHHRRYYYHSNDSHDYDDHEFIDLTNEQYDQDSLPTLIDLTSDNEIENDLVPKPVNDSKLTKNETITNDRVKFQPITTDITANSFSSTQIPTNSAQLGPQFYLSFLRKFIDENWRWANMQLNGRRVFLREQTNDFIVIF